MDTDAPTAVAGPAKETITIKMFGVGSAGLKIMEQVMGAGLPGAVFIAVNADAASLAASAASEKLQLPTRSLRQGNGEGSEPVTAHIAEQAPELKALCAGAEVVFILAGLGGTVGTAIGPVVARAAKETGALVLAFATLPFDWEGSRRRALAEQGLESLKAAADGVVCLPCQKVFKLIDENTSLAGAFKFTDALLAGAVRGLWRLLAHEGLIEVQFGDLCPLLRDRHAESLFAEAEAAGATRSRVVIDRLLAHPLLEGGKPLAEADTVLVSLIGGPDLTMVEVDRVMEAINHHCRHAQVITGAAIDDNFRERLAVTLLAARSDTEPEPVEAAPSGRAEEFDQQLLNRTTTSRPASRYVPPPPSISAEQLDQLMARHGATRSRGRKTAAKMRQGQLPLEIVSKGRFDKSEPTIHKGEDLDVPTYIRRGVPLN